MPLADVLEEEDCGAAAVVEEETTGVTRRRRAAGAFCVNIETESSNISLRGRCVSSLSTITHS